MAENKPKEIRQIEIMEAALKTFIHKGYTASRMVDIVEKSGLSKGAIYHHYHSKQELFLSLIDYWESQLFPDLSRLIVSESAADNLRAIAAEISRTFDHKRYVFMAELEFWALSNRDEAVRRRTRRLYEKILTLIEGIIQNGIASGEFKRVDPGISALAVMTGLQGVIWFSIFENQSYSAAEYLETIMDFIIHGFKKSK
ncbi:MAG: TetR/AcrR family transcriptional regulator [FCB group bacterium]|nr:TetR/AcrR family transcriptional regulator [FCB group bacterium]